MLPVINFNVIGVLGKSQNIAKCSENIPLPATSNSLALKISY